MLNSSSCAPGTVRPNKPNIGIWSRGRLNVGPSKQNEGIMFKKPKLPNEFRERSFYIPNLEEACMMLKPLLIGWLSGNREVFQESQSSASCFHPVWSNQSHVLWSVWSYHPPAMQDLQETQVWSQGWEDLLEEGMETHSSIHAWTNPWVEESGRL